MTISDSRVPGYLGRVLDSSGRATGTCFQVRPFILVTARHVVDSINAGEVGAQVTVDALRGGGPITTTVQRLDPDYDLAALLADEPLPDSVSAIVSSDRVDLGTGADVTGVARISEFTRGAVDREGYRYLQATGTWGGGTIRNDRLLLARLKTNDVTPGMSGAPAIRRYDGAVIGVVSGRYNSDDGWLTDTVWLARTEHIDGLIAGLDGSDPIDPVETVGPSPAAVADFCPIPPTDPVLYLGRHPVTNGQFLEFLLDDANVAWRPGGRTAGLSTIDYLRHWRGLEFAPDIEHHPVVNVDLAAARAYTIWLGRRSGAVVRLPSSADWALAAAAGRGGDWLDDEIRHGRVNFAATLGRPTDVGAFGSNPYDVCDLVGLVYELCVDDAGAPVLCGGAYHVPRQRLLEQLRLRPDQYSREDTGFRCVRDPVRPGRDFE